MEKIVVVGAKRTPIGKFLGSLKKYSAVDLGIASGKEALNQSKVNPKDVTLTVMGHVIQTGLGQNPARQVALGVGCDTSSVAYSVNEVCGSGLKSIHLGMQALLLKDHEVVLVGGMESMSQAPHYLVGSREGKKYGALNFKDTLENDGLSDAYSKEAMGITAENVAKQFKVSRQEQDAYALSSQYKATAALENLVFNDELVHDLALDHDEFVRTNSTLEGLEKLRPAFKVDGSVTAGNSSGMNDGAASLVLTTEKYAKEHGLVILAYLDQFKEIGLEPSIMGYGPYHAIKALNVDLDTVDVFEINEAFAAQAVAVTRDLKLDLSKVNPNGGAIALGHPIGASGSRITVSLIYEMMRNDYSLGISSLCIGGGMGSALLVSRKK